MHTDVSLVKKLLKQFSHSTVQAIAPKILMTFDTNYTYKEFKVKCQSQEFQF